MFQINSNKSPGPDGYGSGFYNASWKIVGQDVTEAVMEFFQNGKLLKYLNSTIIALIPNVEVPEEASQYRPISCYNVLYKCISKLKINQPLSREDLRCTKSINGLWFFRKRGLRQGNPISPLLFVIVMEYLSKILKTVSMLPDFKYHPPMCKPMKLTHLILADDLIIFCKGNESSVNRIMEALSHFSDVTGLVANMETSSIFMAGIDDSTQEKLLARTSFTFGTLPIKYLGLPISPQKWNKLDYHMLVEKIT
ncbi:PREDICTED: uncharacterized protein LOC109232821 [Nicotiana attenuata]|uniref:uncharacterized protein LOC109232821 n=1 Tax=Nicotiana attenuata TaxID=49451 RepID=UPI00090591F8|nr:PREDICTED: uncharacterized protein LOC109232821 [Nicotiana attenuata]